MQLSNSTFPCWDLKVSILSPDGSTLTSTNACSPSYFIAPVALPANGTYTLVIAEQNGNTGTVSVSLSLFNEQTGTSINPGTPVGVTINNPGQNAQLTFSGTAGQFASVQLSNSTFPCWDLNVSILSPDGSTLTSTNACSPSYFIAPVALPANGTYTLVIAEQNGNTGTVSVSLSLFNEQTGTSINPGTPVGVTINNPGQNAQLTFSGTAGQFASVQLSNSTFPCWDLNVSILSPDGSTLTSTNACSPSYFIAPVALLATGTYTLEIAEQNGYTWTVSVSLSLFNEQTGTSINPGTPVGVTINNPGQNAQLTFSGTAGQFASVQLSNSTFPCWDLNVSILSPDGSTLTSTNACSPSYFIAPVAL